MRTYVTLVLILLFGTVCGQEQELKEAKKLVEAKKYNTAYLMLDKIKSGNDNPDVVIEKADILLNYFVTSVMHKMFALKDLKEGEELLKIRGTQGSFVMHTFPIDSALNKLIKKYPENYKLRKSLGNYYHEVNLCYGANWMEPEATVLNKMIDNYKLAYEHGEYDYMSLFGIGYGYLRNNKVKESIKYLKESTELKNDYPSSLYNLAYAYLNIDDRENAITYAKKAYELYTDVVYKSDAANMLGVIYSELKDTEKAIEYYMKAYKLTPDNYYTLKPLLALEVHTNAAGYKKRTVEFINLAPDNPTIYQDLEQIYWSNGKENELLELLEEQKKVFAADDNVIGALYFYIAKIFADKKDVKSARMNFTKAREYFKKVFGADHAVFGVIDTYLKENETKEN